MKKTRHTGSDTEHRSAHKIIINKKLKECSQVSAQTSENNEITNSIVSVRNIELENVRYSLYPGNTITCSAEGFPVPSFRWSDAANNTLSTSATLTIVDSMHGRNTFTCEATNVVKNNTYKIKTSTTFYVIGKK